MSSICPQGPAVFGAQKLPSPQLPQLQGSRGDRRAVAHSVSLAQAWPRHPTHPSLPLSLWAHKAHRTRWGPGSSTQAATGTPGSPGSPTCHICPWKRTVKALMHIWPPCSGSPSGAGGMCVSALGSLLPGPITAHTEHCQHTGRGRRH